MKISFGKYSFLIALHIFFAEMAIVYSCNQHTEIIITQTVEIN